MTPPDVTIREVGLRDGLQLAPVTVPTADKARWIDAAAAAGFAEMEVTSFVPATRLPQFGDAEAVLRHALGSAIRPTVLAPNLKGAVRALEAGATRLTFILTASESFSQANLRRPIQTSVDEFRGLLALRDSAYPAVKVVAGISSAFGCTLEGAVPQDRVRALAAAGAEAGADEVALADTVGYAEPAGVRRLCTALLGDLPGLPIAIHLHDTRGTGLANALAALDAGVRLFESCWGGLGGCPNTSRPTGNVATEDLVYMFEAMGLDTGIDLDRLLAIVEDVLGMVGGAPHHSHLRMAGLPKGFAYARPRAGDGA